MRDDESDSGRVIGYRLRGGVATRVILGLSVLALGILWTLGNLGLVDSGEVLRWWPVILVFMGLTRLLGIGHTRRPVSGLVLTLVGTLLILRAADVLSFEIIHLWPIILILIGGSIVFRGFERSWVHPNPFGPIPGRRLSAVAVLGGLGRKFASQDFDGGDVVAFMGGAEIDLRGARPTQPTIVLECIAVWGGIDIWVPESWQVVNEVTPLLGGVDDKSKAPTGPAATTIVLRGVALMGGIEVKN